MENKKRLPHWLKMERARGANYSAVRTVVAEQRLHTICTSGNCPNIGECWNAGTATFMILGDVCTRACKFCATATGKPLPPDTNEPERLALSIKKMNLRHCVITSVDRDDLPDGGASFWAETICKIKEINEGITIETLIPDFDADHEALRKIIVAGPDVISHNIETVMRLTPLIRTRARYERSLSVLKFISESGIKTKSGFMLGLGEQPDEVRQTIDDLYDAGCRILTIGQYLQPTPKHMEVAEYIHPEYFEQYRLYALDRGYSFVESAPLVRSSFHAEKHAASF